MACELKTVSVLVHEGRVGGTSCEWCRDHISDKFVTESPAGEPYRLPAHEKCHCAWQITKITGITRNMADKISSFLEETNNETDNSDSIQVDEIQIMDECLDIAEQATEDAEDSTAQSEAYYAQAADWLALSEAALSQAESYEVIQAEQQQIMDECLAIAESANDDADAANAASLVSYGHAADYLALSEAALSQAESYEVIQAEQQQIMNDALARAESATDDADAANAASLVSYGHAADYLALSEAEYALGEDDEAVQVEQQAIMDECLAIAEEATDEADAANAASLVSYGHAADYLALSEAAFAQAEDYEVLQEEQQVIMDECIAIAESAIEDADFAYAESLVSYGHAADYLALSEAEYAQGEDCDAVRIGQQAIMNECLDIAEEATEEAEAANAASLVSYGHAANYLDLSDNEYAQGEDCDAMQIEYLAIMTECADIAEEATSEAEAAYAQANYWYGQAEEWYALGEEWYALGEQAEAAKDYDRADYCYNEAETCYNTSSECSDNAIYYAGLRDEAVAIANEALDEYDAAEAIYNANDPAPHYALAASYLQTCNDYLDEGDEFVALGLEATAIANEAQDEYDAALVVFNAHDPAPHYALAASYLQTSNNYLAEGDWYVALGLDATATANEAMDEYDASEAIFNSYDPATLYAQSAADLQTSNDYLDEGDGYVALGLDATAIANEAMDEYDAALAIFNAHDPVPHYALAASYLQTSNDNLDEGDGYVALGLAATAIANEATDVYDAALAVFNAHDPAPHYALAASYLQTSNDYIDEGDGYVASALEALAIAAQAMDNYDAALAVFNAYDPAPLYAQSAADLQSSTGCTDLAVYWAAQSVIFWGTAADALEDHDDAQFVLLVQEDRISILTEPISRYTNCQDNFIIEDELAKL